MPGVVDGVLRESSLAKPMGCFGTVFESVVNPRFEGGTVGNDGCGIGQASDCELLWRERLEILDGGRGDGGYLVRPRN